MGFVVCLYGEFFFAENAIKMILIENRVMHAVRRNDLLLYCNDNPTNKDILKSFNLF